MKSERRHKLETNVLADKVGHSIDTAKPYLVWVLGGIVSLSVVGLVYAWWQNRSLANAAVAWTEFFFAEGKQTALAPIYKEFPNSTAALWARISEADLLFANGLNDVYTDRNKADDFFKKSQAGYEAVLDEAREPLLRERATFGLAQVLESMGKPDEAVTRYREISTMGSSVQPALLEEVNRRLAWLNGDSGKEFFAMFKEFRPSPAAPLGLPNNLKGLSGLPDFDFSGLEKKEPPQTPATSGKSSFGTMDLTVPNSDPAIAIPTSDTPGTPAPSTASSTIEVPPAIVLPPSDNPAKDQ